MNLISGNSASWLRSAEPEPARETPNDLDLMVVLRLLRRRMGLILGVTTVLSALALVFILRIEPSYRAETRVLIQPVLSIDPEAGTQAIDLYDEMERIRARPVVQAIVTQFDLAAREEFNPPSEPSGPLATAIAGLPALLTGAASPSVPPSAEREQDDRVGEKVLDAFHERLSVWRQTDTIMGVSFASRDPQLAAQVPDAMIAAYVDARRTTRDGRLDDAIALLDSRIAAQRVILNEAAADLRGHRETTGAAGDGDTAALDNRLVLLNERLADLQADKAGLRAGIGAAEAALSGGGPAPLNEPAALSSLRQDLQEQQRELTRRTAIFGADFGGVRAQQAKVQELEQEIARLMVEWKSAMQGQLASLQTQEDELTAARADVQDRLSRQSLSRVEEESLMRRMQAQSDLLEQFTHQRRTLATEAEQPVVALEVLTPATVPLRPEGKGRKVLLAVAVVAAALVGLTLAGILELADRSVRSTQQLRADPRNIVLGMLPLAPRGAPQDPLLGTALRTTIMTMVGAHGGVLPPSLMVTAVQPGDGARFVGRALASDLAAAGRGVLLVDALPARGLMARLAAWRTPPGLAEYLRKEQPLSNLIRRDETSGLWVLSRGRGALPALRDTAAIERIVDHASAFGQTVILVCPPVLASAATAQIAEIARGVVLVARWGRTPRDQIALASERLLGPRSDRIMTLLNGVNPRRHAMYSYRDSAAFPEWSKSAAW